MFIRHHKAFPQASGPSFRQVAKEDREVQARAMLDQHRVARHGEPEKQMSGKAGFSCVGARPEPLKTLKPS